METNHHIGKMILSYPIDHAQIFNIVAIDTQHKIWEHEKSVVPVEHGEIRSVFKGWGSAAQKMVEVRNITRSLHQVEYTNV